MRIAVLKIPCQIKIKGVGKHENLVRWPKRAYNSEDNYFRQRNNALERDKKWEGRKHIQYKLSCVFPQFCCVKGSF